MDELNEIVQRMIDAGESEENIALVVQSYTVDTPTEEPVVETDASFSMQ